MCCTIHNWNLIVNSIGVKHASRCFSNEFSQHHWQESFDGDSFINQSKFDDYALATMKPICLSFEFILELVDGKQIPEVKIPDFIKRKM